MRAPAGVQIKFTQQIYIIMATKTISIRLPEEQAIYLAENFQSVSNGVNEALSALKYIRLYSLKELQGKFSLAEWMFLADSLNGTITDGMFRCNASALIAHSEDAETYEGTATKHGVDLVALKKKIETLTGAQVEALYHRVEMFWKKPEHLEDWASY